MPLDAQHFLKATVAQTNKKKSCCGAMPLINSKRIDIYMAEDYFQRRNLSLGQ